MVLSERTKTCNRRKWLFRVLHWLCLFGPLLYFIPYAFITGEVVDKVCLSMVTIVSITLAVIHIFVSREARGMSKAIFWLLIAGWLFCLTEVKTFIWIMCITSLFDELIFVRLKDRYAELTRTNKEIDRRNG